MQIIYSKNFRKGIELKVITEIAKLVESFTLKCEIEDREELLDCEVKELSDE